MRPLGFRFVVAAALAAATAAVGCRNGDQREPAPDGVGAFAGATMGTRYSVRFVADDAAERIEELQHSVDTRLVEINAMMSTYDPGSELSRFNQSDSVDWFDVSPETAEVVAYALQVARDTGGKFDPTVGPAVNLWGFGPDGRRSEPPGEAEIAAALARVGYQAIEVRREPPALKKARPDAYLDLSALAKGFGVDAVSALLAESGVAASMVEIGGEVVCRGRKPDGSSWQIGVEKPLDFASELQAVVSLDDRALATSGDYRNFFEDAGERFSHEIDPATGRPVQHRLAEVSVQAPDCMQADALATALLVMGPEDGYNWASERGVAALLIERTADGFRDRVTPAWASKGE